MTWLWHSWDWCSIPQLRKMGLTEHGLSLHFAQKRSGWTEVLTLIYHGSKRWQWMSGGRARATFTQQHGGVQSRTWKELPWSTSRSYLRVNAAGISAASCLADLDSLIPRYRFNYLLDRVFEVVNKLKVSSTQLLSPKERKDAEKVTAVVDKH